jgi:DNA-binding MarR family transcriptional regulator
MEDAEPQRYTGYLIRRAQQRHVAAWARLVSTETTSVQFAVLAVLDRLGECSQQQLCQAVDLDRSTIADLVARMERRGLLTRRRAADDRRRNVTVLTPEGRAELDRLRPGVEAVERELTGDLDADERAALRASLRRLLEDR